ncbi:MAG: DUF2703 domain-containing protein [Chloroflexota bacterium]
MTIEFLYYKGCSHWKATLEELQELLHSKGVEDAIDIIQVASREEAERLQFPGSPTIRINGEDVDIDPPSSDFGLACRTYDVEGEILERPPREWIDAALDDVAPG